MNRRQLLALLAAAPFAPVRAQRSDDDLDVPFVSTPPFMVARMMEVAGVGPSDFLIDLGSGDGRIAIAAARRGARALGVDIDPDRIAEANLAAQLAELTGRVRFRRQDLFATPLREATVIAMYLLPRVNLALRPRLLTEARPGTRIVSHAFHLGDWEPDAQEQVDGRNLFFWVVPGIAGGSWALTTAAGTVFRLEVEQRYQRFTGTAQANGQTFQLSGTALSGTAIRFRVDGRLFVGRIGDADITAAPDAPADVETGWRAVRVS